MKKKIYSAIGVAFAVGFVVRVLFFLAFSGWREADGFGDLVYRFVMGAVFYGVVLCIPIVPLGVLISIAIEQRKERSEGGEVPAQKRPSPHGVIIGGAGMSLFQLYLLTKALTSPDGSPLILGCILLGTIAGTFVGYTVVSRKAKEWDEQATPTSNLNDTVG